MVSGRGRDHELIHERYSYGHVKILNYSSCRRYLRDKAMLACWRATHLETFHVQFSPTSCQSHEDNVGCGPFLLLQLTCSCVHWLCELTFTDMSKRVEQYLTVRHGFGHASGIILENYNILIIHKTNHLPPPLKEG